MSLRSFEAADLVQVQELIHYTIDSCYSGVYPPRAVRFFKEFHSLGSILDRQAAGRVLVFEQDGAVVATGSVVADEITGVFVHPEFQNRGIGGQLMDELEGIARAGGLASAELSISLPSRHFYESRGYKVLDSRSIDVGEGERLDYWAAEKPLSMRRPPLMRPASGGSAARFARSRGATMVSRWLLRIAGVLSLVVAVFQAVVCFSPYWSIYFGAPETFASSPLLLIGGGLVAAVIFAVFGLYALAGAESIRPLPLLRAGLLAIGGMYALRGLLLVPQLIAPGSMHWMPGPVPPQMVASSVVSLIIGVLYLVGTMAGWQRLSHAARGGAA